VCVVVDGCGICRQASCSTVRLVVAAFR
jgi:hypothetical protein